MRLTPKLIAAFILTALVPLAALGYLSYITARPALEKQVINSMVLAADAIEGHLYSYFEAVKGRVLDFSSDGHIRTTVEGLALLTPSDTRYKEIQNSLGAYLRRNKMSLDTHIRAIAILDTRGKVVASTDDRYLGLDESHRDYFLQGRQRAFLSGTVISPIVQTQDPIFLLPCSAPLTSIKTWELRGVIINFYQTREIEQVMSGSFQAERGAPTSALRTRGNLDVYLVDRDKKLLTPSRYGGSLLRQQIDTLPVRECQAGRETSGIYRNHAGVEVIGASMCIPSTGWTLLVETSTAEAFTPTQRLRNNFFTVGILIALAVTLAAYLIARRIARPMLKLSKATQRLGSGDFGIQVAVTSRDEIGELATSFNSMVARLAESRTDAAAEKNRLETLIREISEGVAFADHNDNILMLNPRAEQILGVNEADVVGKPLHLCHGASREHLDEVLKAFKHGQQNNCVTEFALKDRHFEVTMSPIWQEGRYVGTIKVLHDITEHKLAEEAVNQANEKLTKWVEELEERNREIALLSSLDELLQACRTSDEAYRLIAQYAGKLFHLSSGTIYSFNASRNALECTGGWGPHYTNDETRISGAFGPEDCWALRRGQPHVVESTRTGLTCAHIDPERIESHVCVPLIAHGDARGVISLEIGKGEGALHQKKIFSETGRRLAISMAGHVALALENLKSREILHMQSIRDPLTGTFNRRYMEETLDREVHRANRSNYSFGVIMLDLDHFKKFNDTHGHNAGDVVLREVGALLSRHTRAEDVVCRYGGEEFTIILPEITMDICVSRAEQLRQQAGQLNVFLNGQTLGGITMSLGVALFSMHGPSGQAVLEAADAALYRAKHEGRNRVVVAESAAADTEGQA